MMQELTKGSILQDGRYQIEGVLGRGGFGITYIGETEATLTGELGNMGVHVKVTIKEFFMRDRCMRETDGSTVNLTQGSSQEQVDKYKQKFIKEAQNLAGIHHPNIINVSDVFEENQTVYYVMQYLPGGSLSQLVRQSPTTRLDEETALRYIREIGSALQYLHAEKKMCHLDVKPANILIGNNQEAVLIDFGISKTFDDEGNSNTSSVNYSNNYAPLEQYQAVTTFSPQTDLYSLGATLYFMLTGNTPPEASKLNEDGFPPCPYYITPGLWQTIDKAMQPRKKDRPVSVEEWLKMLSLAMDNNIDEETVIDDGESTVVSPTVKPAPTEKKTPAPMRRQDRQEKTKPIETPKPVEKPNPVISTSNTNLVTKPEPTSKGMNKTVLAAIISAIVIIAGYALWTVMGPGGKASQRETTQQSQAIHATEAFRQLGETNLTLQQIQTIEKSIIHDGNPTEEENLKSRIIALKHFYIEGLLPQPRNIKNIQNIFFIHADELSPKQREIISNFLKLPDSSKQQWEQGTTSLKNIDGLKMAK